MKSNKLNLRAVVLTWTILTTTFFWTSTMRILFKPEISSWSIFGLGGKGFIGDFWLLPLIILFALFIFYLEGRGRLRILYHILLIIWHLLITAGIVYGSFQSDANISFGTWGISFSFIWLVIPFVLFLLLAIALVILELSGKYKIPRFDWTKINWKPFLIALLLFPVALLFFRSGTGFNWLVKIAVASTIIQWILLTETFGRPFILKSKQAPDSTDR
ncbi:MAG: hypothetical protein KGZ85_12880 [Ignavibacterium sp.]|nr:hypothetical protein [Ignavibacterium sp.]